MLRIARPPSRRTLPPTAVDVSADTSTFVDKSKRTLTMARQDDNKIDYPQGFFFPIGGQIFGGVLLVISLFIFISSRDIIHFCIGTAVTCFGLLLFSTKGFDIDTETKKVRQYTKVLWIKTGKSIPISNFKYITIINQTYSQSSFSRASVEIKSSFGTFNLLLLNDTHHLKQLVDSYGSLDSAQTEAKKLADALHLEIVTFNPVRTQRTKRK